MTNDVSTVYVPHTVCKHSTRVTPVEEMKSTDKAIKLPDLYLTHDLLGALHLNPKGNFRVRVTFAVEEV